MNRWMVEMVYGFLCGWEMNSGTPLSRQCNFIAGGYANRVVAHKFTVSVYQ